MIRPIKRTPHVETVPAFALGVFVVAREIGLAIVGDVVLAGQEEDLLVGRFDDLIGDVPLFFFGNVADIAGMNQESVSASL